MNTCLSAGVQKYLLEVVFVEGFCEQVVKVKRGTRHVVYSLLIIAAFLIPIVFLMMLFYASVGNGTPDYFYALFALVLAMFGVFTMWLVIPRINKVEYDYSVLGNKFAVDKVVAQSSRKKKLRVEIKNIEKLAKLTAENYPQGKFVKKFDFTGGADVDDIYFAEFRLADKGLCMMLFTPNEKILEGMKTQLRREIVIDLFYKKK